MRLFNLILIALLIHTGVSSCKFRTSAPPPITDHSDQAEPTSSPTVEPIPSSTPVRRGVELVPVDYFTTPDERILIKRANLLMNEVLSSDCYFNFMSSRKMIQTNGKTALAVATEFKNASGVIPVEFYYPRFPTSTIAYRQPPSNTIHINRRMIGSWSKLCDVAGTFAHESVGHSLLNYDHDMKWSYSREYSAPYSSDHAFASEPYSGSESGKCCHEPL